MTAGAGSSSRTGPPGLSSVARASSRSARHTASGSFSSPLPSRSRNASRSRSVVLTPMSAVSRTSSISSSRAGSISLRPPNRLVSLAMKPPRVPFKPRRSSATSSGRALRAAGGGGGGSSTAGCSGSASVGGSAASASASGAPTSGTASSDGCGGAGSGAASSASGSGCGSMPGASAAPVVPAACSSTAGASATGASDGAGSAVGGSAAGGSAVRPRARSHHATVPRPTTTPAMTRRVLWSIGRLSACVGPRTMVDPRAATLSAAAALVNVRCEAHRSGPWSQWHRGPGLGGTIGRS